MNKSGAFLADYVDLVFRKTRKVAVVMLEIPIETANEFVAVFGTPNQATGVPVALAPLDPDKVAGEARKADKERDKPRGRWDELKPAAQAALRCKEPTFQKFIAETFPVGAADAAAIEAEVAALVRELCGVKSRGEILDGTRAASAWRALDDKFLAWREAG